MTKKLKITLIILLILAVIVALLKGVFVVRNINVSAYETSDTLAINKCADIKTLNEDILTNSIFTLKTNDMIERIESNNPTIRVVSIVRTFPNTLDITIRSREELISIQLDNGSYLICDYDIEGDIVPIRVSSNAGENTTIVSGLSIEYELGVKLNRNSAQVEKLSLLVSAIADRGFSPAYMFAKNIVYNISDDNFVIDINNDTYDISMQFSAANDTYKKVVSLLSFYNTFASQINEDCVIITGNKITTGTNIGYYNIIKMTKTN